MRLYETIFIIRPNAGEDDVTALIDRTSSIITDDGGMTIRVDKWGLRKLAYLIKKETQGYYVYLEYGAPPAAVAEMERILKIDDRVLKYMTVKLADAFDPEEAVAAAAAAQAAREAAASASAIDDDGEDVDEADDETDDETDD